MIASLILAVELVIPLETGGGNNLPMVKGSVDGAPCTLIFDTGATHTSLDLEFVREKLPNAKLMDVELMGTSNVQIAPKVMRTELLTIGEMGYRGFPLMAIPLNGLSDRVGRRVDGILGMDIIRRMPMIISLKDGKITINPESIEGFGPQLKFDYEDFDGSPKIDYRAPDGTMQQMLIDSGSTFTILRREEDWAKGGEEFGIGAASVNGRERLTMRDGGEGELTLVAAFEEDMKIKIRPMINPSHPCAYLGADTLQRYDLYLKFPEIRLKAKE